ncbi:MAG: LysE family transporter [Chromatiaceae bacterium]|nr:LysE family transporter [Chromatiaceae bacterium]
MLYFLIAGVLFGISAGFSPGPLLALVVSETLQHGIDSGIKVALAPIVTDIPIVALVFLLFTRLSEWQAGLGIISLAGGCYVLYMSYTSLRVTGRKLNQTATKPNSLSKGVLTNALSPHPYLFWLGVGAPMVTKSVETNIAAPIVFVAAFYVFLIGSKIVLAVLVGRSKSFMSGTAYSYTMRFLSLTLAIFSLLLFYDGLTLLDVIAS